MQQRQLRAKWLLCSTRFFAFVSSLKLSRRLLCGVRFVFVSTFRGGIWKFRTSSFKCYVDHPHTMYKFGKYRCTKLGPSFWITLYCAAHFLGTELRTLQIPHLKCLFCYKFTFITVHINQHILYAVFYARIAVDFHHKNANAFSQFTHRISWLVLRKLPAFMRIQIR